MDENRGDVFAGFTRDVTLPQPAGEMGGGAQLGCLQGVCATGPEPGVGQHLIQHLPIPDFLKSRGNHVILHKNPCCFPLKLEMLSNCGTGEDSRESLGQQEDQTSQS